MLTGIFSASGLAAAQSGAYPAPAGPPGIVASVAITVTNTQSQATPGPYQQEVAWPSTRFTRLEASNLGNMEFMYLNGTVIPSWLESNPSNTATASVFWLKLESIPANSNLVIYAAFADPSVNLMNGNTVGEAPQLSASYAQYDNGANIFPDYWNFAGTSLPSGWVWTNSAAPSGSESVSNGLHFSFSSGNWYTMAAATQASSSYAKYVLYAYQDTSSYTGENTIIGEIASYGGSVQSYGYASVLKGYVAVMDGEAYQINYSPGSNSPIPVVSSQGVNTPGGSYYLMSEGWPATGTEYAALWSGSGSMLSDLGGSNSQLGVGNTHLYLGMYDNNKGGGTVSYQFAFLATLLPGNAMPQAVVSVPRTFWNWQGYLGNNTIYLTQDPYGAYVTNSKSAVMANATSGSEVVVGNALNFSTGTPGNNAGSTFYSFSSQGNFLLVTIYLGVDSGSYQQVVDTKYNGPQTETINRQATTITIMGSLTNASSIQTYYKPDNFMGFNETINSSGKLAQVVVNELIDGLSLLPVVGYAITGYQMLQTAYNYLSPISGTSGSSTGLNSPAYESIDVNGGGTVNGIWQNVFAGGANASVQIPSQFFSFEPGISLEAQNIWDIGQTGTNYYGATAFINYTTTSDTAAVAGTIDKAGGGTPLANSWITVFDASNGSIYMVKTNSAGQYSLFLLPNSVVSVSASYQTPWGTAMESTGNTSIGIAGKYIDDSMHNLGDEIYGQVIDSTNGDPLPSATVYVEGPNGYTYSPSLNANGDYSVFTSMPGSYSVWADYGNYASNVDSFTLSGTGINQQANLQISVPSGGCVLNGTLAYLASGQKVPVQNLSVGEQLLSYNILQTDRASSLSTSGLTTGTIKSIMASNVTQIVDINHGLLYVSGMTDQPLFAIAQNGTAMLVMLGNLTVGMMLYDAVNNTFIPVTNITVLSGNFTVYDIVTSSSFAASNQQANNYVTGVGVPMATKEP